MAKTKRSVQWIKAKNHKYAGVHLIAEFWHPRKIENRAVLKKILVTAAKRSDNIPLETAIHKFSPQGVTAVILLAESHIALHSWYEFGYLAIDIFTCGDKARPEMALKYLEEQFRPRKVEVRKIKRGIFWR